MVEKTTTGDGQEPVETLLTRCAVDGCEWCSRSDYPCRCCGGTGQWRPERPRRDADGVIGWVRVLERCRMCGGTGKEHNPL